MEIPLANLYINLKENNNEFPETERMQEGYKIAKKYFQNKTNMIY